MDIYSIRHRGLQRFFEKDETRGLPQNRIERLRRILSALDEAESVAEIDTLPGWRLHRLRGDRVGTWSISLSGNWRITFRIQDDRIYDLDLEDYH
ncbi:MAG: type II toxin-antitoxin system RelE/ParE family toxin [Alphaproteobacteria bacterium]|jgi:proteic killer suppression protein|nr:type II toxin-antitoxin system RelE/ParE family toxin [Alphaproteobacteria bacterium]